MYLDKKDLYSLLELKGISKELYTHPVVSSLLTHLLIHFNTLTIKETNHYLDEIMTVSNNEQSFSLVFNRPDRDIIFSYKINDSILEYTKQSFTNNSCTIITKYFNQKGRCLKRESITYPLSQPESYNSKYYELKEEDISL